MHKLLLGSFLLLVAGLSACSKDPSPFIIDNLNGNTIAAFGHGGMGMGFKYPTNTNESIEACLRIGADGTEMDVQLSRDSVLVLYHDALLETETDMKGMIHEKTWAELLDCRYANPFSNSVALARADQVLDDFADTGRIFTFDCKLNRRNGVGEQEYKEVFAQMLVKLIHQHSLSSRTFIESNDENFLRLLRQKDPQLRLFIYPESFEKGLEQADRMNLFGITISNKEITTEQVKLAHQHGRRIALWSLHTTDDNIDAIRKSPDYMQTDKIIHLLEVFDGYKRQGWRNLQW